MLSLGKSVRLPKFPRIAFVGAGGKTTAIFSLARQIPTPVIVTTTTHIGNWELGLADNVFILDESISLEEFNIETLKGVTLILGPANDNRRHIGVSEKKLKKLFGRIDTRGFPILIEADGSRKRPLKAPADYEPAIPDYVNMVIVVAGMSALGKPLSESTVHRPEIFSNLSGISQGDLITREAIVNVLGHPSGGLKNIPIHARRIVLLNQADSEPLQFASRDIAEKLLRGYESVIVGSLYPDGNPESENGELQLIGNTNSALPAYRWLISERVFSVHENIAGVILAAGASQRFGEPKQLVDWQGKPLIRHIVLKALDTRLSKIIVVTGAYSEYISQEISDLPIMQIHNPGWSEGQSSSIRLALNELGAEINGVVFILADQPYLTIDLIQALITAHSETLAPIIAPKVENQRGNPVLFDRSTFSELLSLSGNQGGREIFNHFKIRFIEWSDPNILIDIDTMDDYLRMRNEWDER